ncbi:hypothetical protein SPBRAN_1109 [uncultured Candidatus Thioglobus sp.]|nr:hypothetical protein SPBRAN_1109 [uncultured Candidatus Thioglobus sp.]
MVKKVIYFYEGETEKNLLKLLKNTNQIKTGRLEKINLWKNHFHKIIRKINKTDELFFIVDTDDVVENEIFINNMRNLKTYNACFVFQCENLEDELCFSCSKGDNKKLFGDFYKEKSSDKFKSKFKNDKNLSYVLTKNNFDFNNLWIRGNNFSSWLQKHSVKINVNCKYRL